jgi:ATP-dependent Clp protease adaptor protein ClpS
MVYAKKRKGVMSDKVTHQSEDLVVQEAKPKIKRPPLYRVILLNDDYTTMDFVIMILERVFHKNREQATQIMLHVHTRGKGICGVYTREVAETKVQQVMNFAQENQQPLQCAMEPEG